MSIGRSFRISDHFIKSHCAYWTIATGIITSSLAGIAAVSTYITSETQVSAGYFLFPLVMTFALYPNLIRAWKEEQQWVITLLPGLIRYNGPRIYHDIFHDVGKALGEGGKEEYQRDIKLEEIAKIEATYSRGQLIAIDYTTNTDHNHRILCYENLDLILQHMQEGAGSNCKFERYTRKVPYIWP